MNAGMRQSGVYYLQIRGTTYWFLKVYCEQEIADGGWTVRLKRSMKKLLKTETGVNRYYELLILSRLFPAVMTYEAFLNGSKAKCSRLVMMKVSAVLDTKLSTFGHKK